MKTCTVCGNHLQEGVEECPQCKRIKESDSLPNQVLPSLEEMPICPDCGNRLEKDSKVCPHCREIRMQDAPSRQPGKKTAAEEEAERRAAQFDTPVEQIILNSNSKMKYISVGIAVALIVIALAAWMIMS